MAVCGPSAICSYIGEYTEDLTGATGYGRLGDYAHINLEMPDLEMVINEGYSAL